MKLIHRSLWLLPVILIGAVLFTAGAWASYLTPIAYYSAESNMTNIGAGRLYDWTGKYNLTLTNPVSGNYSGAAGKAVNFTGTSADTTSSTIKALFSDAGSNFTVAGWIKTTYNASGTAFFGTSGSAVDCALNINQGGTAGLVRFEIAGSTAGQPTVTGWTNATNTNGWVFWAIKKQWNKDGTNTANYSLYFNGALANASAPMVASCADNTLTTVSIGRSATYTNVYTAGYDEFYVYNESLSSQEIEYIYSYGVNGTSPFNVTVVVPSNNLSITAQDKYGAQTIITFNASIAFSNGTITNYTTTTSQINTSYANNASVLANITVTASGFYFQNVTLNWNTSNNLVANVTPWANVTAGDNYSSRTINVFTVTFNGSQYNTAVGYVQIPAIGTYNATANATNYINGVLTNVLANATQNVTLYPWAWITARDLYDSSLISAFNVTFNSTVYSTTNGTVQVPALGVYNASVSSANYFTSQIVNGLANASNTSLLFQAQVAFNATEVVSGLGVTTFSVNTSTGINANGTSPTLYLKAGTYNLTWNKTGWYNLTQSFTITALENDTRTFTNVYKYILNVTGRNNVTGNADTNFTIVFSSGLYSYKVAVATTTGNATIPWANDTNINLTITNSSALATTSQLYNTSDFSSTPVFLNVSISSFQTNTFSFYFYSEKNSTAITTNTGYIYITGSSASYNYTTNGTNINTTIIVPDSYVITFGATGYLQRQILYTLTNQSFNVVPLFLLGTNEGNTLETFYASSSLTKVAGVNVTVTKKNLSGTNYYTVFGCTSDANGRCVINVNLVDTTYRVMYTYGQLTGSSGDVQFTVNDLTTGRTFYLGTGNNSLTQTFVWNSIGQTASITFLPGTSYYNGTVRYTLSNPSLLATAACLYIYRSAGYNASTLDNYACTSASSAVSLDVNAANSTGTSLTAVGTVVVGGIEYKIIQSSIPLDNSGLTSSARRLTLWAVVIAVVLTLALSFTWNPIAPPIIIGFVLWVFSQVGLLFIPIPVVISIIVIPIILVLALGKKT